MAIISIRKNSKKRLEILNLESWKMSNLSNHFSGEEVKTVSDFAKLRGDLTENEKEYTLHVHSNLWYTKSK